MDIQPCRGPLSAWSYHGPLHYGLSRLITHTKWIRCSSRVHAGMGYDVPLHLLIPPCCSCTQLVMDLVVRLNWRWKLRSIGRITWPTTEGETRSHLTTVSHQHRELYGDWRQRQNRSNQSKKSNAWVSITWEQIYGITAVIIHPMLSRSWQITNESKVRCC